MRDAAERGLVEDDLGLGRTVQQVDGEVLEEEVLPLGDDLEEQGRLVRGDEALAAGHVALAARGRSSDPHVAPGRHVGRLEVLDRHAAGELLEHALARLGQGLDARLGRGGLAVAGSTSLSSHSVIVATSVVVQSVMPWWLRPWMLVRSGAAVEVKLPTRAV